MTVKLYVNWNEETILSEKQAHETVKDKYYYDAIESNDNFDKWLSENYSCAELFDMDKDEKEKCCDDFREEMEATAWSNFFDNGYEEISIEI